MTSARIDGFESLGGAFAARVAAHPGRVALRIVRGPGDADSVTYAQLDRRVRAHADELRARFAAGSRILIGLPTSIEFAEAYFGCLVAGMVAVPVPHPAGGKHAAARVAGIVRDCDASLVLASDGEHATFREWLAQEGLAEVACESLSPIAGEPGGSREPGSRAEAGGLVGRKDLAVLQYSSGSTGEPKGVMLTHGNVLSNIVDYCRGCDIDASDRFGAWLPLHHDMGLFSQLTAALILGTTSVLMPPLTFVRRPAAWLRMLDEHAITVTAAPNFAFDLCTRLVTDEQLATLDLSRLRYVFNGSEPIHVPTMLAFAERFAAAGLPAEAVAPAYGLAESTVFVSTKAPEQRPTVLTIDPGAAERGVLRAARTGRELAGCGVPGGEARIVDPATRRELPAGRIGELWLRGPSVGIGYWGRPELSRETFDARLSDGDAGWLRTGDLASLVDGELVVTGRIKEMLIVYGRNLSPQDIEEEARPAHPALDGLRGAAFGVAAPDERVVVVHEVARGTDAAVLPSVAEAVKQRLSATLGIPVRNVVLVDRGTVRRTTSGKIQRLAMRSLFLAGELRVRHDALEPAVERLMASDGPGSAIAESAS